MGIILSVLLVLALGAAVINNDRLESQRQAMQDYYRTEYRRCYPMSN